MSRGDFWSKRKAAVQAEEGAELEAAFQEEQSEKTDEEVLEELGLPDPDALQPGDDFSAFMAKAVPARLRNKALRKLWLTNPTLANLDNLVDYGQDFTDSAMAVENIQTAYQVGKGMLSHIQALAEAEEAKLEAENAEDPEEEIAEEIAASAPELSETKVVETETAFAEDDADTQELAAPRPRRMQFSFETERV